MGYHYSHQQFIVFNLRQRLRFSSQFLSICVKMQFWQNNSTEEKVIFAKVCHFVILIITQNNVSSHMAY